MIQPKLTKFTDFIEQPKPVIPKTKIEVQQDVNHYLNICVLLIILIGIYYLYRRYIYKEQHELETKRRLEQFDEYLNEYYINDMIDKSK